MPGGNARDTETWTDFHTLPPVEFSDFFNAVPFKERAVPKTSDKAWPVLHLQTGERLNVQVVVMVMADENEINWRQMFKSNSRKVTSLRSGPAKRAGALRPGRISQDVDALHLNEHGRVIDEGDSQVRTSDA